ncbi:MAG: efflux RND transporter periplasmic adaptor subunit, partial [Bacteroidales bacterium]|nr:efflux RND transporter periplasmic adaptor subunit [Bacteroidales bacterium]
MNRYFLLFSIIFLVITGCHHKEEKSDAYGNFEADEVMVAAESNGKILYLSMAEGSSIEKGAVVGLVDTIDFYLQKLQLINSIESVKISKQSLASEIAILEQQRDNLRKEYHRLEKMFADGAATQKQIDEANGGLSLIDKQILAASSKYNSIDSEIEAYQISLRQAEVAISRCKIVAPVSGTVLSKYLHEGEFAAVGRPVFKVADLSNMYLRV